MKYLFQDHVYMLVTENHVPKVACSIFAFLLGEFMAAQSIVVVFTALNAVLLVIFRIKVELGRFDWKLVGIAFGLPMTLYTAAGGVGMLGSNGGW